MPLLVFIVILFLSGCASETADVNAVMSKISRPQYGSEFKLYAEKSDYKLAKNEAERVLLGCNIINDTVAEGDINKFEDVVKKSIDIYSCDIMTGDDFPYTWVLEMYVNGKLPLVTIYPRDGSSAFNIGDIEKIADSCGDINIPMFIELYPNCASYENSEKYVSFFKEAYELFSEKAPNAAIIWSVSLNNINNFKNYYPGDDYLDWVGVNAWYTDEDLKRTEFEKVYYEYQDKKPIIVSQFGVSHYSTNSHSYNIDEASDMISECYSMFLDYPRTKAIVYSSVNNTTQPPLLAVRNDFTITSDEKLLKSFSESVSSDLSRKEHIIKIPFNAYVYDGSVYVNEYTFENYSEYFESKEYVIVDKGLCYYSIENAEVDLSNNIVVVKN